MKMWLYQALSTPLAYSCPHTNHNRPGILVSLTFLPLWAPGRGGGHVSTQNSALELGTNSTASETSHILSFPQPGQMLSYHGDAAAPKMQWLQTAWVVGGLRAEGGQS